MIRFIVGFILVLGGAGGIEANTEVLLPLDSLTVVVVGFVLMAFGAIKLNKEYDYE